jgi:hypothetical protein
VRVQWDRTSTIHSYSYLWPICSVRKGILYNYHNFVKLKKLVGLIKLCLNETYSKVRTGNHLSDKIPLFKIFLKR